MPLLTVVVPVYRVEDYLRQCLDSIVDQGLGDLEVIVVDDRSPDGSGKIADEYASKHAAVRAIHLPENVGLGRARNAGLAEASGDYVWFVDSDDWLAAGALRAVAERLTAERDAGRDLDMLVVDYARHYEPEGVTRRSAAARTLARTPGPEVFTARQRPAVLSQLHVAWSRVVRRSFLHRHDLVFHLGLYEDVSWTYPALLAAERIGFLDRVCVYYRQREGAITKTGGERHLDVVDHWTRVLENLPADHPLRPELFRISLRHCADVMGNDLRVPDGRLRRRFFYRLAAYHRRFAPPGWRPAGRRDQRLKTWLVARRVYPAYAVLRLCWHVRRRLTEFRARVAKTLSRG
ncbi:MAG: glycosyltransferase [Hamadaea sp.]|nr:glycosyltransferase [Hamadaea sp.]